MRINVVNGTLWIDTCLFIDRERGLVHSEMMRFRKDAVEDRGNNRLGGLEPPCE